MACIESGTAMILASVPSIILGVIVFEQLSKRAHKKYVTNGGLNKKRFGNSGAVVVGIITYAVTATYALEFLRDFICR